MGSNRGGISGVIPGKATMDSYSPDKASYRSCCGEHPIIKREIKSFSRQEADKVADRLYSHGNRVSYRAITNKSMVDG